MAPRVPAKQVWGLGDIGAGDLRRGQPVWDRRPPDSEMEEIAARIFLSCRGVIEDRTSNLPAVDLTALE
jgi:hypothetical protein